MRAVCSSLAMLLLACASCGASPPRPGRAAPPIEEMLSAVVAMVHEDGSPYCAGVVIDGDVVMTAAHCVDTIESDDGTDVVAEVQRVAFRRAWTGEVFASWADYGLAYLDEVGDVAVLRPSHPNAAPLAHSVLSRHVPIAGQHVYVVGHPVGLAYSIDDGIVAYARRESQQIPGRVWMQISAPVSPGNSGGPVYDDAGEVVGLVSFRFGSRQGVEPHLAGAVHVVMLWEALAAARRTEAH